MTSFKTSKKYLDDYCLKLEIKIANNSWLRIDRIRNIVSQKCNSINNKMIEQTSLTEEETPTCAITQTIERNARHNFVSI